MTETHNKTVVTWRNIPNLKSSFNDVVSPNNHLSNDAVFTFTNENAIPSKFATVSASRTKPNKEFIPTAAQLLNNPLAVIALVPKDAALFFAGAVAGAAAKSVTAPLDRIKLLMQVWFTLSFLPRRHCTFRCFGKFGGFDVCKTTLRFCRLMECELDKKLRRKLLV